METVFNFLGAISQRQQETVIKRQIQLDPRLANVPNILNATDLFLANTRCHIVNAEAFGFNVLLLVTSAWIVLGRQSSWAKTHHSTVLQDVVFAELEVGAVPVEGLREGQHRSGEEDRGDSECDLHVVELGFNG